MTDQDEATVPIEQAAEELGIEVKRLRGYCLDRRPWMPIGDGVRVYPSSLASVRRRLGQECNTDREDACR
jgi:hypothetical protein